MKKIFSFILCVLLLVACSPKKQVDEVLEEYSVPAVEDVVIYQVNPRVFAAENSFNAILPHLDSIKSLGTNILWFMPLNPIGIEKGQNSPYSVRDYYDVNAEFGTLEDFKNLIVEAHKRDMGVIIDWVPNHTSWDNAWIANKDWYTQDNEGNIIYPEGTNWTDVADLNFNNHEMRLAMIDAMKYWAIEVGIDGFRCDAVDFVPADFLKQCNDSLRAIPNKNLLMLAEGSRKDHFESGFDLNYAWDFAAQMRLVYQEGESAASLFTSNEEEYADIPEGKMKLRFTTNHDEAFKHAPVVEWVSETGSMSAFATVVFFPGCPMIYSSQEVGYPNPINFFEYVSVDWNAKPELRAEYKRIIDIHNSYDVLRNGEMKAYPNENILLFERYNDTERIVIAINVRNSVQQMDLPEGIANQQFINLYSDRNLSLGDAITLQPFEYLILK